MKKYIVILPLLAATMSSFAGQNNPAPPVPTSDDSWLAGLENRNGQTNADVDFQAAMNGAVNAGTPAERVAFANIANTIADRHLGAEHERGTNHSNMRFFRLKLAALLKPESVKTMVIGIGAAALLTFGAWHTSAFIRDTATHYLKIPPLAQETSIRSWTSWIKSFFVYDEQEVAPRTEVILSDELADRAEKLTQSIINAAYYDTFFRHYMFYGPAGTGKTMLAKAIAQEAGLEYIYFSAAKLDQYELEDAIKQLTHLFEYAKAYPKKLMIIIDEADNLFAHRENCSNKTRTMLNLVLTYMGNTEQSDFMVIAMTNRPKTFDKAAMSRFGEKVKIDRPEAAQRRAIFEQYAQKYFIDSHTINCDNRSLLQKFFTRTPQSRMPLILADDVWTDETFDELTRRSEGMVGRDISDIMLSVQNEAYGYVDHMITKDMLLETLERKKLQNRQEALDFTM